MILNSIIIEIEKKFPKKIAENWDNVGLMVGKRNKEIKRVLITLDCDLNSIEKAIKEEIDLIISHHPLIFNPIKNVTEDTVLGKKIMLCIENNIAVYSIHTNVDSAFQGLNEYVMNKIGAEKMGILSESQINEGTGIGRYYTLHEAQNIVSYLESVKKNLKLENILIYGAENRGKVKKIALVNGAGADFWKKAAFLGCDLLITGDVKHHDAVDAVEAGFCVADIGHYDSEKLFLELFSLFFAEKFPVMEVLLNERKNFLKVV